MTNPLPATGGADRETIEEAKARAPYTIKSRDRAVTAEDFEMLALRASTHARARASACPIARTAATSRSCSCPRARPRGEELTRRLVPSNEVLRYVKRYLDERKLVGTVLNVVEPRYKDLSLRVVLIRRTVGTSRPAAQATSSSSCAASCTRWSAAATARAGSSAARCSRPS